MLLSGAASEWHTASLFAVAPYMEVFMCYSLVPLALPPASITTSNHTPQMKVRISVSPAPTM